MGFSSGQKPHQGRWSILVRQRWNSSSAAHVEQMVDCFEEADYSLHEIDRDNYVQMYLACSQMRHIREVANAVTV